MTSMIQFLPNSLLALFPMNALVAQTTDYQTTASSNPAIVVACGVGGLLIAVLMIASYWKIFAKAGRPGWAAIIPVYNYVVMLQIAGLSGWFALNLLLLAIPLVNILGAIFWLVVYIMICLRLAQRFGKGGGFAVGLILLPIVFFPMLGFGSAQYQGPAAGGAKPPA